MQQLRVPGPTPCPEDILAAVGGPMINHRGPEFKELIERLTANLKKLFLTKNDVFFLTASGTGAMEAAVVNTLSPGDKVLSVTTGVFGQRFANIAKAYGANVQDLTVEYGQAAEPETVRRALRADPAIRAVVITHNETSTGVTNDLAAISRIVKGEFDKLLLVDAVSSIGSIPLPVDEWQCDIVATGSQKGWMAPPGIAMISVGPKAWEASKTAKMPRFYFDLTAAKNYLERAQTPWTPALSVLYGLDVGLQKMLKVGLDNVHRKQARIGQLCREGVKSLGLSLLADERHASNTVTAVKVPAGVDGGKLVGTLRTEHNVVLAGGQGPLTGKIFRIGHLGWVEESDIQAVLEALRQALPKVGFTPAAARRS
ncbi:MAG: alanine--glyoxylate aminotransferase family protein [Chloroflexi bacterium]|nr:alanine--glyoxylate aminotransferase family protein [Chloroflexota bacterium]